MVPNILPRGSYRVISRRGGSVQLIDGYRFEVDEINKEIRLLLPPVYSNVEAVEEKYVKAPLAPLSAANHRSRGSGGRGCPVP
jgi:hypothetical protein